MTDNAMRPDHTESCEMYDSVEIVPETYRDGAVVPLKETRKPMPAARNPQVISGAIRQRAEDIASRFTETHRDCSNQADAMRICELLDELDSALNIQMYEASARGRKS